MESKLTIMSDAEIVTDYNILLLSELTEEEGDKNWTRVTAPLDDAVLWQQF